MEGAKQFWLENKPEKAIKFVKQALTLDKDNGDVWALYLKYLQGSEFFQQALQDFEKADPCHGIEWPKLVKQVRNWCRPKREVILELSS